MGAGVFTSIEYEHHRRVLRSCGDAAAGVFAESAKDLFLCVVGGGLVSAGVSGVHRECAKPCESSGAGDPDGRRSAGSAGDFQRLGAGGRGHKQRHPAGDTQGGGGRQCESHAGGPGCGRRDLDSGSGIFNRIQWIRAFAAETAARGGKAGGSQYL